MADSVFISYRRSDTGGHALSLFHQLRLWFDTDELFFDQSSIDMGNRFPESIEAAIDAAKVVLVVIGPDWLRTLNERATQPGVDYVRVEVARALARHTASGSGRIVPVLMGGGPMPAAADFVEGLRGELSSLLACNAHEFKGVQSDLDAQFERLRDYIASIDGVPAPRFRPPTGAQRPRHIPHGRNPNFTGRNRELDALQQALASGQRTTVTALAGLGGVGKTQLALEYSYRHEEDYAGIWWFRAETPEALGNDMQSLAAALDVAPGVTDQSEVMAAVHAWLDLQDSPWLLVYDNAPGPDAVLPILPARRGLHHIIVTSRHTGGWGGVAQPLEVATLQRDESIVFLLARTRQDDRPGVERLADTLGDLPLALEQAGATIEALGVSIGQYLTMFEAHRAELLERRSATADYPESVATTWALAFEAVEEQAPLGAALLKLLSFFSPDAIPQRLITDGGAALPEALAEAGTDALVLADSVGALRGHSLLKVEDETWSVHRLVQTVTRDQLGEDAAEWAAAAVNIVNAAFPFNPEDPNTWTPTSVLLPHALTTATFAEHHGCGLKAASRLLNGSGLYLKDIAAQVDEARGLCERALEIDEKVYGPEHPNVAKDASIIGLILQDQGQFSQALKYAQRALEIDEKVYGPEHPNVALRANNISAILHAQHHFAQALKYAQRALEIYEKACGPEHPNVATILGNIGQYLQAERNLAEGLGKTSARALVLETLRDFAPALEYAQRALEIDEKAYGPEHPKVAIDANNVGQMLKDQGDFAGALEYAQRALEIDEKAYGPEHPKVAIDANNIGMILEAQGDLDGALEYIQRALAISEKTLGESHPSTLTVRRNLESLDSRAPNRSAFSKVADYVTAWFVNRKQP